MTPVQKAKQKVIELKTDPDVFDATARGEKTFEIRYDDRGYKVGDRLLLKRTRYTGVQMRLFGKPLEYTGEEIAVTVTHVQRGYGISDNWVGLSHSRPGLVFRDNGDDIEQRMQYHAENSCPACGGSGHKDDYTPQLPAVPGGGDAGSYAAILIQAREEFKSGNWHFPMRLLDEAILCSQRAATVVPDGFAELVRFAYSEGQGRPINELSEFRWVDSESKRRLEAMLKAAHPAKHTRSTLPDGVTRVRNVATGEITERRAVPDGYVMVPVEAVEILDYAPELNPSNYDHDQVCALNSAVCESLSIIKAAQQGAAQ